MARIENNQVIIIQKNDGVTTVKNIGIKIFEEDYLKYLNGAL